MPATGLRVSVSSDRWQESDELLPLAPSACKRGVEGECHEQSHCKDPAGFVSSHEQTDCAKYEGQIQDSHRPHLSNSEWLAITFSPAGRELPFESSIGDWPRRRPIGAGLRAETHRPSHSASVHGRRSAGPGLARVDRSGVTYNAPDFAGPGDQDAGWAAIARRAKFYGSIRSTVPTRSILRSNDATASTPDDSALATR